MKILLLSAYNTASHNYWCDGLQQNFAQHEWVYLSLPARYFSWRIRGNSLTWAFQDRALLEQQYDLVIATSMTDLCSLRGFVPSLTQCKNIVYFHENQFAYPVTAMQHKSIDPQIVSLYSALSADEIIFNSQYNLDTFLSGAGELLRKMPDAVPNGLLAKLGAKASVLPVPLFADSVVATKNVRVGEPLQVLWNHRWEYDKGPDRLLRVIEGLPMHLNLQFHIVGQQFRQTPSAFEQLKPLLLARGWLGSWGYVADNTEYQRIMRQSDLVLSTALHDFQGLAVQLAVLSGCIPLVPNNLAYPEWFDSCYQYDWQDENPQDVISKMTWLCDAKQTGGLTNPPSLLHLTWPQLRSAYAAKLAPFRDPTPR